MSTPAITNDPLYQLLRDGNIAEFNQRIAAGDTVALSGCNFRHLNLQGLDPTGLDLSNCYFRQTDLRGIDFTGCLSLEGASIHGAKISGALFPKDLHANEILLSLEHGTRMRYQS